MTNEQSPRPWRVEENVVGWSSFIVDANGDGVSACWRTARVDDEKERQYNEANAALIVDAVNEYEELAAENNRLRKEVGRLRSAVKLLGAAAEPYCAPELRPVLIAEARAEIEEELNERKTNEQKTSHPVEV